MYCLMLLVDLLPFKTTKLENRFLDKTFVYFDHINFLDVFRLIPSSQLHIYIIQTWVYLLHWILFYNNFMRCLVVLYWITVKYIKMETS